MGRSRQKKAAPRRDYFTNTASKKRPRLSLDNLTEDLDDDIDKFHKGADKISLDVEEDLELSNDDAEEPVLDLKAEGSSNDDDEDSDDELDEEQLSGLAAKMAKQSKLLRQKTVLMDSDYEDEIDDEYEVKDKKSAWGKRKRTYYDADTADYELLSSDDEAAAEEEVEALRLQRQMTERLQPEDFELDMEDYQKPSKEEESSLQELVAMAEEKCNEESKNQLSKRGRLDAWTKDKSVHIEVIKRDVNALSKEEQMDLVSRDAPELMGLLKELRESSHELYNKIEPLLLKVKALPSVDEGVHLYVKTKHMLLLSYIQTIVFYLLMKAEGHSVRDHPVIARLVEIRTLLQKLQPIEKTLHSQIDGALTSSKYISPLTEVKVQKNSKLSVQLPSTPSREENSGASDAMDRKRPEDSPSEETAMQKPMNTKLVDNELTIPSNLQPKTRSINSDDEEALHNNISLYPLISTKTQKRRPVVSGDMNPPVKEDIGVRRAKIERQRRPHLDNSENSDEAEDAFEDDFYQQAKQRKDLKKAAREKDHTRMVMKEMPVEEDVGKRHITYEMEKNKGLTPYRKRLTKNPRKKYKFKHQKAVVRRKGQVREVKAPVGPYGGEATGIRTAISRSVRFHS